MPKNAQEKQGIPESLLTQLNEHTQGGFCILYVNNHGEPAVITEFDTLTHQMGMYQFAADYFTAINRLQREQTQTMCAGLANVISSRNEEPHDEDGDTDTIDEGDEED